MAAPRWSPLLDNAQRIVRNIVYGHEGEVHAEPSPAGGAAFVVRLPLA